MDTSSTDQETLPDHLTPPPGSETAAEAAPTDARADNPLVSHELAPPQSETSPSPNGDPPRFEIDIYQIVDDSVMKKNRHDGTGFDWKWADFKRDWMEAT